MKVSRGKGEIPTRLGTRTKETTRTLYCESVWMCLSDPKDGELCLFGLKGCESVLEDPSCSDVQLDDVRWA